MVILRGYAIYDGVGMLFVPDPETGDPGQAVLDIVAAMPQASV